MPIAISGCDYAEKLKNETSLGFIKFRLNIQNSSKDDHVTLIQLFKAIFDFYETLITEDQYIKLLNEPQPKQRQKIFESFQNDSTTKAKKRLREYFAGSMYFEGYYSRDKLMQYGT